MSGLLVKKPGPLTLLQDAGRFGRQRLGLSNGGPLDQTAFAWANRLVHNPVNATALEISLGGLELLAQLDTLLSLTGGDAPLHINERAVESWRSHRIRAGDTIRVGFARQFCRAYLAVAGGFAIAPQFGSSATVPREGIGGLDGGALRADTLLPCAADNTAQCLMLAPDTRPVYSTHISLRVIPGYQQALFPAPQQQQFFSAEYLVTNRSDRMGYCLQGAAIRCAVAGILSEGNCLGAIQIPADGQPIVLLTDRQTIGGYPKIGAALALDCARLAQLVAGASVRFTPLSPAQANTALRRAHADFTRTAPLPC